MKDQQQRRQAIDLLVAALKEKAKRVTTLDLHNDGLGLYIDWDGSQGGMTIRTKRVRSGDDWELWFVEPPGHPLAEVTDVRGAVFIIRDLSGDHPFRPHVSASAQTITEDPRREQLSRLTEWLRGDKAIAEIAVDPVDAVLTIVRHEGDDLTVTCRVRHEDGGRLWFFDGAGRPIAEAVDIADAALRIRERALSPL